MRRDPADRGDTAAEGGGRTALPAAQSSPLSEGTLDDPAKCFAKVMGSPQVARKRISQPGAVSSDSMREIPTPNIISSQRLVSVFRARQGSMLMLITHCYQQRSGIP